MPVLRRAQYEREDMMISELYAFAQREAAQSWKFVQLPN